MNGSTTRTCGFAERVNHGVETVGRRSWGLVEERAVAGQGNCSRSKWEAKAKKDSRTKETKEGRGRQFKGIAV